MRTSIALLLLTLLAAPCRADDLDDIKAAIDRLEARVSKLEGGTKPVASAPVKHCRCEPDARCQCNEGMVPVSAAPVRVKPVPAHVVDETGVWWQVAEKNDPNQRSWYSEDGGRRWFRDEAAPVQAVAPSACHCPATGNKDGRAGPNNCKCHDLGMDCKCHKGAGIVFDVAPVSTAAPQPAMRAAPVMAPVRRAALPFVGSSGGS